MLLVLQAAKKAVMTEVMLKKTTKKKLIGRYVLILSMVFMMMSVQMSQVWELLHFLFAVGVELNSCENNEKIKIILGLTPSEKFSFVSSETHVSMTFLVFPRCINSSFKFNKKKLCIDNLERFASAFFF